MKKLEQTYNIMKNLERSVYIKKFKRHFKQNKVNYLFIISQTSIF